MTERAPASIPGGFTPLVDDIVDRYGVITAAVWGRMWRYAQGGQGVCNAAVETIAHELRLSRATVIRHIDTLVAGGYLADTTPKLRNRPHIYIVNEIAAPTETPVGVSESNTIGESTVSESNSTVSESNSTVSERYSHCIRKIHEDTKKREVKKQFKRDDALPKNGNATAGESPGLSDAQQRVLELFGAKRYKTPAQRAQVLALEQCYGPEKLTEYAQWAAQKGLTLGSAVTAGDKTLAKWGGANGKDAGVTRIQPGRL